MTNIMQMHYDNVLENGRISNPRGFKVKEVVNRGLYTMPGNVYSRPGGNSTIGFIELLQFIAGTFRIETFKKLTPNARLDLFTYQSAYGPRTLSQIPRILNELRDDPDSRRAVVMIANPNDTSENMPCTLSMQFQIKEGSLIGIFNMRSSDLIWGLPTDIIQFGGIVMMIAICLKVKPGMMMINAGNAHIYEDTHLRVGEQFSFSGTFQMPAFTTYVTYINWAKERLRQLESGATVMSQIFPIKKQLKENNNAISTDRKAR